MHACSKSVCQCKQVLYTMTLFQQAAGAPILLLQQLVRLKSDATNIKLAYTAIL